MQTRKLALACPVCGSAEVFYSCTPNCCFNHVCAECGSTFEPATRLRGGSVTGVEAPDPMPEAADPTAACVKCDSTAVYVAGEKGLVCAKCGALLELEINEIAPGSPA